MITVIVMSSLVVLGMLCPPLADAPYSPGVAIAESTLAYTFGVGSDSHYGSPSNLNGECDSCLISSLQQNNVQRHFALGDLVDGSPSLHRCWKEKYDQLPLPYHVARGNHDGAEKVFMNAYGLDRLWYNVTDGDLVWIVLDSANHYYPHPPQPINATQLAYLENALSYYSDRLCFILMHVPQVKHFCPSMEASNPEFQAIVEAHSSSIGGIFAGHVHNHRFVSFEDDSVRYFYTGTVGSGYGGRGQYSYLVVGVYEHEGKYAVDVRDRALDPGAPASKGGAHYLGPWVIGLLKAFSEPDIGREVYDWANGLVAAGETATLGRALDTVFHAGKTAP